MKPTTIKCVVIKATLVLVFFAAISAQMHESAVSEEFYFHVFKRSDFFNHTDAPPSDPVSFSASLVDLPDPPEWLDFSQRDPYKDAVLYGTPNRGEASSSLEIVALNQRTQQISHRTLHIQVKPGNNAPKYLLEMRISNMEVDDILLGKRINSLLYKLLKVWPQADNLGLVPTQVKSLVDVTSRVPLIVGVNPFKGVLVQVSGLTEFSRDLNQIEGEIRGEECQLDGSGQPVVQIASMFSPPFEISWCYFRLIDLGMQVEPPTPQPPQPISLESDGWNTDVINGIPPRDLNVLFYVSVILPLIIAAAIFVLLSIIMLGNRQGLEKRNKETSATQLSQFNTICRATANLRYMSQSREAAPILGGQSGFSTPAHSASRATTPKRSQTDLAVHATSSLPHEYQSAP